VSILNDWAKEQFGHKNRHKWNWKKYKNWLLKNGTRKIDVKRIESFGSFAEKVPVVSLEELENMINLLSEEGNDKNKDMGQTYNWGYNKALEDLWAEARKQAGGKKKRS